jgi:hypothetical protein
MKWKFSRLNDPTEQDFESKSNDKHKDLLTEELNSFETLSIQQVSLSEATSPRIQNSLLTGEYDERESQASFQAALAQWRKSKSNDIETNNREGEVPTHSSRPNKSIVEHGTQIQAESNDSVKFEVESDRSYFERLLLTNKERCAETFLVTPSEAADSAKREPDVVAGDTGHDWTEEDENDLQELLKTIHLKNYSTPDTSLHIEVEDITNKEQEFFLNSFQKGIAVEIIPFSKLKVIEPETNI